VHLIAKTLFIAKTLCTYSINILRREKSLRDHADCPFPVFRLTGDMPGVLGAYDSAARASGMLLVVGRDGVTVEVALRRQTQPSDFFGSKWLADRRKRPHR
jgi:hypothetical protein